MPHGAEAEGGVQGVAGFSSSQDRGWGDGWGEIRIQDEKKAWNVSKPLFFLASPEGFEPSYLP